MKFLTRLLFLIAVAVSFRSHADARGILDPKLEQRMNSGQGPFEVIVTFTERSHVNLLSQLGVRNIILPTLPMAGAVLSASQINQVLAWEGTESIYFNDRLSYSNYEAGEITGAHFVQAAYGYRGAGRTILVLDSGIDGTHPDLSFGPKVIQNVKVVSDLGLIGTTLYIEGVPNTDNSSGHGTHVAGTVGGTGVASATDERAPLYYRGLAPDARIVGVGAGEGLSILAALEGFDYAIANKDRYGIDVITNSWGNSTSQYDPNNPISKASYEAYRKGICVTFAASNDGPDDNTMSTYAINPWVISVAAGTKQKDLADFSSRGEAGDPYEHPDLTAPGVDISSTRAPGTVVGALGPVVNLNHPDYYLRYHTISGTSMATPFVAGAIALLLQANPHLSPDQVEEILTATADPMPGYALHQAGAGYINVRSAVDRARLTVGNRIQFLAGDVKWSTQGSFSTAEQNNPDIIYVGRWENSNSSNASGGSYTRGSRGERRDRRNPLARITFFGTNIKLGYPRDNRGGTAEVFIDGASRGTVNYYSDNQQWNARSAFGGLANDHHVLEIRGLTGRIYLDNISIDGRIVSANTTFMDETETFSGSMGPSVTGIPETRIVPFTVAENTVFISAETGWTGGVDIDMYLLDPDGNTVASDASLNNPEVLGYWVERPGMYAYKLVGYATVVANYSITSTQTRAVTTQGASAPLAAAEEATGTDDLKPRTLALYQNYPNPFNPRSVIRYDVPLASAVQLKVFNILGQEVMTLVDEAKSRGRHEAVVDATNLPSGMYIYRLVTNQSTRTRRLVVLK
jgi:serine protease AprX